jgi:predicted transcriptional regulator
MEQITNREILEKLKHIEKTMATRQELEEAMETIAVLSNEDTLNQIKESEKDINNGNFKEINSVEDL